VYSTTARRDRSEGLPRDESPPHRLSEDGLHARAGPPCVASSSPPSSAAIKPTYCTAWHYENSYDTVTVVDESPWVAELEAAAGGAGGVPAGRHFVLTIDSWGCLEVVASGVRVS
jgi:hypothetical protein